MTSQSTDTKIDQDENNSAPIEPKTEPSKAMPTNFHQLLLNRNKKPLAAKNAVSQVPSTPANIKRLQVNKWFNSPTDNLFSPCTKKLYKKTQTQSVESCDLTQELNEPSEANQAKESNDQK